LIWKPKWTMQLSLLIGDPLITSAIEIEIHKRTNKKGAK
jgi:hypothetical protein